MTIQRDHRAGITAGLPRLMRLMRLMRLILRLWQIRLWCVPCLWIAAGSATAFESREHQRLSDLAFTFALDIHCKDARTGTDECEALHGLFTAPTPIDSTAAPKALSYGDVVRCVDFFLTPEKMLAGREDGLFSRRADDGSAASPNILPQHRTDYTEVDFTHHCSDSITNLAGTQAAHSNHAHFQAELIASQALYHRLAMQLRREGRTFAALFVNGIADHYLQDFFAPGHIGTFRSHMSDIYSNALHDSINHSGARLRFERAHYQALLASLGGDAVDLRTIAIDTARKTQLTCLPAQAVLDEFMRATPSQICGSDHPTPRQLAWLDQIDDLASLLGLPLRDAGAGRVTIRMVGDNELWQPTQQQQRVLMLALQIRSILDVLRAPAGAADGNWFAGASWTSRRMPDDRGALITASIDGHFEFKLRFLRASADKQAQAARIEAEGDQDVVGIAELNERNLRLLPSNGHEVVLSVGFNYEVPRFGSMRSRTSVSFETPVLAFLTLGNSKINFGMTAGAFRSREVGEWRSGISLRPGLVLSQSETFISAPVRWFHYDMDGGHSVWRPSWGLRLDQGFSSFMTVFLQYSQSPFRQDGERIARGPVFGAGVVFAAPLCRVPKLGNWIC